MLRCHNTCEGKSRARFPFFPVSPREAPGTHQVRDGCRAPPPRLLVFAHCSLHANVFASFPGLRHSLCLWTGEDPQQLSQCWSPVYSPCSPHCKETTDKTPMFFYSGGRTLLFGHDPCLGLEFVGHYIEPLSYDEYPGGKA